MNKKLITVTGAAFLIIAVYFSAIWRHAAQRTEAPKVQSAAIVMATATLPPSNDIYLSSVAVYGDYNMTQSGTPDNPIVVWGNGAKLRSVYITGSNVIWRDTIVTGADGFGIRVKGKNNQIINNTVYDTVRSNWDGTKCKQGGSWNSAIRAADATDIIIYGNNVSKSCGEGISILRSSNVTVENNTVFDTYSVNIYPDQSSFVTIRNNYSYSTGDTRYYKDGQVARGILIGAEIYTGWAYSVHDILIENNILERVRGINYYQEQAGTPYNVLIKNNVFINVPAPLFSLGSWATVANNITATPSISTPAIASATASRTASPTALQPPTATKTFTPTALPPTVTKTFTPAVVPTVCETAISNSYWFMGCTK